MNGRKRDGKEKERVCVSVCKGLGRKGQKGDIEQHREGKIEPYISTSRIGMSVVLVSNISVSRSVARPFALQRKLSKRASQKCRTLHVSSLKVSFLSFAWRPCQLRTNRNYKCVYFPFAIIDDPFLNDDHRFSHGCLTRI